MDIQIKLMLAVVLSMTVAIIGAVLSLLWSMPDIPEDFPNNIICLPDALNTYPKMDLKCGAVADEMRGYILQGIDSEYESLYQKEQEQEKQVSKRPIALKQVFEKYYCQIQPAARFTGETQNQTNVDAADDTTRTNLESIRKWRHGRRLTDRGGFRRYGIKYNRGRIMVPVGGTYQVYSFLDLYEPCIGGTGIPDVQNISKSIKHSIYKFNIDDDHEQN